MAKVLLTDQVVKALPAPQKGQTIVRDSKVRGFGVRILPPVKTKQGLIATRAYILAYTAASGRRVYTLGDSKEMTAAFAREEAIGLKAKIRASHGIYDPAKDRKDARESETVDDLCQRFKEEHFPKLRKSTRVDYKRMLDKDIRPAFGKKKVLEVRRKDIDDLHRAITQGDKKKNIKPAPTAANFCLALCSKLFNFAVDLEWIEKNPCKGIKKNPLQSRTRYLTKVEIAALNKALGNYPDQNVADIFRLLLLTGARRGEVRAATWDQLDLTKGHWKKDSAHTKQRRVHQAPLSAPARELLSKRRTQADGELKRVQAEIKAADPVDRPALEEWRRRVGLYVFPARAGETGHIINLKKPWEILCKSAGIDRKGNNAVRVHDLRHTAASILASGGVSLPLIGQLLGHTQPGTTARYAHLFDDSQRMAVEKLGAFIVGGPSAKVIEMEGRRRK